MLKGYRLLTAYIILAYIAQGVAEHFCLPTQPINNYFVKELKWEPTKLAAYMALLMVPWTCKPAFGAMSDALQTKFGSKRSYLALSFFASACGYLLAWIYPALMTAGLLLSACGLAWGTALLLGLIIEKYPKNFVPYIFSLHFVSYYSASICSGLAGGRLCHELAPQAALNTAFGVSFAISLIAAIVTPLWIKRDSEKPPAPEDLLRDAGDCLKNRSFWLIAVIFYCWSFAPAFGTTLYFQYAKQLHITQAQIGEANASCSLGMLLGALIYPLIWKMFARYQVQIAVGMSVVTTLAFLNLNDSNYIILEIMRGVSCMLTVLCLNWLAASVAPKGLETFVTASLIGVYNVGTQTSGIAGAYLYSQYLGNSLNGLLYLEVCVVAIGLMLYFAVDKRMKSVD